MFVNLGSQSLGYSLYQIIITISSAWPQPRISLRFSLNSSNWMERNVLKERLVNTDDKNRHCDLLLALLQSGSVPELDIHVSKHFLPGQFIHSVMAWGNDIVDMTYGKLYSVWYVCFFDASNIDRSRKQCCPWQWLQICNSNKKLTMHQ
jgi:hypothetical protein